MKKRFSEPFCEVVRFHISDVVRTSTACCCDVEGDDWGQGENETTCVGKNLPECTCGLITEANCI